MNTHRQVEYWQGPYGQLYDTEAVCDSCGCASAGPVDPQTGVSDPCEDCESAMFVRAKTLDEAQVTTLALMDLKVWGIYVLTERQACVLASWWHGCNVEEL
jgi:hypothetical protein